jgi:NNP family nitrate/nitrite transporter-like MFS transporter
LKKFAKEIWALTEPSIQGTDPGVAQDEKAETVLAHLGPLLLLALIFLLNFMARIILAPLLPTIEKDLGIGHGEAGSLFLLISVGFFPALLGSGYFSSLLTHRKTIILSSSTLGIALLGVSLSHSLWGIRLGLIFLGMAAGLYLPSGIATLTSMVAARHWGKALAIHELAPNLSFVLAPFVAELFLGWFSWRGVVVFLGGVSLLVSLVFIRFGKGGDFPGEAPSLGSFRALLADSNFRILVILFCLAVAASMGIFAMLPLYLVTERAMQQNHANTLIALSRISGPGMAFIAGWAADRLGPKRTLSGIFLLSGLATVILGIAQATWMTVVIFIQPALAVSFFPAGFAALALIGPPAIRNLAVSASIPIAFLFGAGAIPIGIGIAGDAGYFSLGIFGVGVVVFAGFIFSLYLRFPKQKQG